MGERAAAVSDFEMAQSLRYYEPYSVACLGLALVHQGLDLSAQDSDWEGKEKIKQGLAELNSAVAVVSRSPRGDELALPSIDGKVEKELEGLQMESTAYDPFFLRGAWSCKVVSPRYASRTFIVFSC